MMALGIVLLARGADNNIVEQNYIGTNARGTAAVGNVQDANQDGVFNPTISNPTGGTSYASPLHATTNSLPFHDPTYTSVAPATVATMGCEKMKLEQ